MTSAATQCAALTAKGVRCRKPAKAGSPFCATHQNAKLSSSSSSSTSSTLVSTFSNEPTHASLSTEPEPIHVETKRRDKKVKKHERTKTRDTEYDKPGESEPILSSSASSSKRHRKDKKEKRTKQSRKKDETEYTISHDDRTEDQVRMDDQKDMFLTQIQDELHTVRQELRIAKEALETCKDSEVKQVQSWMDELERVKTELTMVKKQLKAAQQVPRTSQQQEALNKLAQVHYIRGPINVEKWVGMGKTIYMMGDMHVLETKCPKEADTKHTIEIPEYLSLVFQTASEDQPMDFFYETEFISNKLGSEVHYRVRGIHKQTTYLDKIQAFFDHCLQIKKTDCPYKHVRFHYVDPRTSFPRLMRTFDTEYNDIECFLQTYCASPLKHRDEFRQSISDLQNPVTAMAEWFEVAKIKKQMDAIRDDKLRNKIQYHIQEMVQYQIHDTLTGTDLPLILRHLDTLFDLYVASTLSDSAKSDAIIKPYVEQHIDLRIKMRLLRAAILRIEATLLDAYTLGRMFRSFQSRGGEGGSNEYSGEAQNIIFYGGDLHVQNQLSVLAKLGFQKVNQKQSMDRDGDKHGMPNFQCVDMRSFGLPLFA